MINFTSQVMPDDDEIKTEKLPVSQVHKAVI
jgi:hypothetical protein